MDLPWIASLVPRCAEHQEGLLELLFPMMEFESPEMNGFLAKCEQDWFDSFCGNPHDTWAYKFSLNTDK